MTIKKHANGIYYAHLFGQRPVNLHTQNKETAQALARESRLAVIEFAARAQAITAETMQRIMAGGRVTCEKALSEWSSWATTIGLTPNTITRYTGVLGQFLTGRLRDQVISLTEDIVDQFVNPTESPIVIGTRNNRLAAVQSFFKACVRRGLLLKDPSADIVVKTSGLTFEQKEPHRREIFTEMELALLSRIESPFWKCAVVLGQHYGLRLSDVATLEWASLTTKPGRIIIWTDKHDKRLEFPVCSGLMKALPAAAHGRFVFPEMAALAVPEKRAALSVYFRRELDRVGVPKGKSFHCLRHTFAVRHQDMGESVDEIRLKLGHSSADTTQIYLDHAKN